MPLTDCISEKKTLVGDAKDIVYTYNLIEYGNNYAKTSGNVWQYHKGDLNDNITDSESFEFKGKLAGRTLTVCNNKDVEIAALLKYQRKLWRNIETSLINCEIDLMLISSGKLIIINSKAQEHG